MACCLWTSFLDGSSLFVQDATLGFAYTMLGDAAVGAPITGLYQAPFEFTGIIHSVDVRVERADRPR